MGGGESSLLLLVSLVETGEKPFQPVQFAVALSIYLARQLGVSAFSEPRVGKDGSVVTQLEKARTSFSTSLEKKEGLIFYEGDFSLKGRVGKRLGRSIVCSRPRKWVSSGEIALGTCIRCGVYSPVIECGRMIIKFCLGG